MTPTAPGQVVLTLDATGDGCAAGLVRDGETLAERVHEGGRGSAAVLPALVGAVLDDAGLRLPGLSALVVTVGPGSFTGVRAALALAHGIALGTGLPLRGVLATAAIRAACPCSTPVWVATASRRGRVFLDIGASGPDAAALPTVLSLALDDVPRPDGPVGVAGDAASAIMDRLGFLATLLPVARPTPAGIAAAPAVPPAPFYVDPPEARPNPVRRPLPA